MRFRTAFAASWFVLVLSCNHREKVVLGAFDAAVVPEDATAVCGPEALTRCLNVRPICNDPDGGLLCFDNDGDGFGDGPCCPNGGPDCNENDPSIPLVKACR